MEPDSYSINVNEIPSIVTRQNQLMMEVPWNRGQKKTANKKTHNLLEKCNLIILYCSSKISWTISQYCLGLTIGDKLTFATHVSKVCKLYIFCKSKKKTCTTYSQCTMMTTIYFQGILPTALFGILFWTSSYLNQSNDELHGFIMKIKKSVPNDKIIQSSKTTVSLPTRPTKYTTTFLHHVELTLKNLKPDQLETTNLC